MSSRMIADTVARAIGQPELEVLAAVALGPQLAVAHEQDDVDVLSVGELVDEHGQKR